jgi:hypothetical protein
MGPFTYTWWGTPLYFSLGCPFTYLGIIINGTLAYELRPVPTTVPYVTCFPNSPGEYQGVIGVNVTDSNDYTTVSEGTIFAQWIHSDPTVSVSPSGPITYDVGQTAASLNATVNYNGSNTANVEWYDSSNVNCDWNSIDTGDSGTAFTPSTSSNETTYYCAVVSDSGIPTYFYASNAVEVIVSAGLTVGTPTASPPSGGIDVGQTTVFMVTAHGGVGTYTYMWSGLPTGCSSFDVSVLWCTPYGFDVNTTFSVTVTVTDSNMWSVESSPLSYTVDKNPHILGWGEAAYVTTILTGPYPWGVYVETDSTTHTAYVVDSETGTVTEINLVYDSVIRTLQIPHVDQARGVWFDQRSGFVWVCSSYNSVMALNGTTGAMEYNISVGPPGTESRPTSLAFDSTDNSLWVTDFYSAEVSEISLTSDSVIATLSTPEAFPYSIAIDDATQLAFITVTGTSGHGLGAHGSYDMVLVLNVSTQLFQTSTLLTSVPDVYSTVAVDPTSHWVFVTDEGTGTVTAFGELNYTSGVAPITAAGPSGAFGVALDPSIGLALVTSVYNDTEGQFYCMDGLSPIATTPEALNGMTEPLNGSLQLSFDTELNLVVVDSVGTPNGGLVIIDAGGLAGLCSGPNGLPVQGPPRASTIGLDPDVGQTVMFHATVTGGTGIYSFVWSGLPTGCTTQDVLALSCTPTGAGVFSVRLTVTDSNGFSVTSGVLTYVVHPQLVVGTPAPSAESFSVGQAFTISTAPSGGSGDYTAFSWDVSDAGLGCVLTDSAAITCNPSAVGSYSVTVSVTDSNGETISSSALELFVMDWNYGNLCSVQKGNCQFTGSSHCDPALAYSFNGSYQTLNVRITGSSDCVYLNVSGSHDVVNIQVTGSSMPYLQTIMAGMNDFLNIAVTGSSDSSFAYVFGQKDVYNLTVTGSSVVAKTYFLGFVPGNDSAPAGNLSRTDSYNLKMTGSTDTQSIVYVNSVGWSSAAHKVSAPKNIATGSSDYLVYQNLTGVWGGPWDTTSGLPSFIPSTPTGAILPGNPV